MSRAFLPIAFVLLLVAAMIHPALTWFESVAAILTR